MKTTERPDPSPHFGEQVWSDYFDSWLVVVEYESDGKWWFVADRGDAAGRVMRAQTPLSAFYQLDEVRHAR